MKRKYEFDKAVRRRLRNWASWQKATRVGPVKKPTSSAFRDTFPLPLGPSFDPDDAELIEQLVCKLSAEHQKALISHFIAGDTTQPRRQREVWLLTAIAQLQVHLEYQK